ncbi:MAG: type II toxin-antitoxin system death-on-curing family toxin [Pyrinomonadaceae bacterium]
MNEKIIYLSLSEAVKFHVLLMRRVGEERFGVFDRALVDSALTRPKYAAQYENADIVRQAATLLFGLIKSHPWIGGNKRTATLITSLFLKRNGQKIVSPTKDLVKLCLKIEANEWEVYEIDEWLRPRIEKITE